MTATRLAGAGKEEVGRPPAKTKSLRIGDAALDRGLYTVGLMFWLWRNRFVGSYLFFSATSRS
jgi:hypothetical protein